MKGTKSSLFLIELMISLLLFAFCAAICIQLFHASNSRTKAADDLAKAVFQATAAAEVFKSCGGELEGVAEHYDITSRTGDSLEIAFDGSWNVFSGGIFPNSGFVIKIDDNGDGSCDVTVLKLTRNEDDTDFIYHDIFAITVKAV